MYFNAERRASSSRPSAKQWFESNLRHLEERDVAQITVRIKGGATVGAVGADCPHWQEAVGTKLCFCPHKIWPSLIWKKKTAFDISSQLLLFSPLVHFEI